MAPQQALGDVCSAPSQVDVTVFVLISYGCPLGGLEQQTVLVNGSGSQKSNISFAGLKWKC